MTQIIRSVSEFSAPTKSYEESVTPVGVVAETSSPPAQLFVFESYVAPGPVAPEKHKSIRNLVQNWEADESKRAAIEGGRRWVAEALFSEDGATVRTLRLRKGWSQSELAEKLSTSQSHVARIERGTENLAISTCRKLAQVFGIDMNCLNTLLRNQEAIYLAKKE